LPCIIALLQSTKKILGNAGRTDTNTGSMFEMSASMALNASMGQFLLILA